MPTIEPKCEACGADDEVARKQLLMKGQLNYGYQPDVRSLILCQMCRDAQAALIRATRDLPAPDAATADDEAGAATPLTS